MIESPESFVAKGLGVAFFKLEQYNLKGVK